MRECLFNSQNIHVSLLDVNMDKEYLLQMGLART